MLVYADRSSSVPSRDVMVSLRRQLASACSRDASHESFAAALIDCGSVESAVADRLLPHRDEPVPLLRELRAITDTLGSALACSWAGHPHEASRFADEARQRIDPLQASGFPERITLRTPEGYAFYALYPEAYVDAAREWLARRRPERVVCIGLRSIGTSLASAVQGGLVMHGVPTATWTLRPRGHPFDRSVAVDETLLQSWIPWRSTFLLVDEGPGLSGSSLAGAAEWLSSKGVADDRIVFVAAWNPPASSLRSPRARARWARHEVITAPFARVRQRVLARSGVPADAVDLSAGRWRETFLGAPASAEASWPAVHPQHERVKFLAREPGASGRIVKFAGLTRFGEHTHARARRLADEGWVASPAGLAHGFLSTPLVHGCPMIRAGADAPFLDHAARYVAWIRRHEATGGAAAVETLTNMLEVNAREALGDEVMPAVERLSSQARQFGEPQVNIDGRLQMHEWIRSGDRLVKCDALDHHCDHFIPGPADAAWDVAAVIVEGDLPPAAQAYFVRQYERASSDTTIERRLPFHLAAYCAFRVGYWTLAQGSVGEAEGARVDVTRRRYEARLRSLARAG